MNIKQQARKLLIFILLSVFSLGMTQTYQLRLEACESTMECDAELAKISENIKATEDKIKQNKETEKTLRDQIIGYNEHIELTNQKITALETTITHLEQDISNKEKEIAKKDKIIINQFQMQQKQSNNLTFLSLLLSSHSISDFIARWSALETISSKEKAVLDEVAAAKASVEVDKQEQQTQKETLETTKSNLDAAKKEKEQLAVVVRAEAEARERELDKYSASAEEIAKQREIINRPPPTNPGDGNDGGSDDDGWHLPVAPGAVITTHFLQTYEYSPTPHLGTDIADATNTPVHSVADGYVLAAGWYGDFGNLVAVGHVINGTYYVSMYGHLNYINVSEGQYVYGGNTLIGGIGNTGYSFGSHLHIELAPRDYFTINKSIRSSTNTDVLDKLNWRSAYPDRSGA